MNTTPAATTPPETSKPTDAPPKFSEDGLPETFSEEDLGMLDDEERQAILAEQTSDTANVDKDDPDEAAKAAAAQKAIDDKAAADAAEAEAAKAKAEPPAPAATLPDLSAEKKAVEDGKKQLADLTKQLTDGEISEDDFYARREEIDTRIIEANSEILAAEKVYQREVNRSKETREKAWYATAGKFQSENPTLNEPNVLPIFDRYLKQSWANPAHKDWDDGKRLRAAQRQAITAAEELGLVPEGSAAALMAKQVPPTETEKKAQVRTDARPEAPTLAGMTQVDASGVDDGSFAAIDRAIDEGYEVGEKAVGALDPDALDRYLKGA